MTRQDCRCCRLERCRDMTKREKSIPDSVGKTRIRTASRDTENPMMEAENPTELPGSRKRNPIKGTDVDIPSTTPDSQPSNPSHATGNIPNTGSGSQRVKKSPISDPADTIPATGSTSSTDYRRSSGNSQDRVTSQSTPVRDSNKLPQNTLRGRSHPQDGQPTTQPTTTPQTLSGSNIHESRGQVSVSPQGRNGKPSQSTTRQVSKPSSLPQEARQGTPNKEENPQD